MKYKVGDKVKVRQDLIDGECYGRFSWISNKSCKYIMINEVWADYYVAQNNGTSWYYTDEMLDGLADEPEENPKEPTDAELIAAAEMLKVNCEKHNNEQLGSCHCIFAKNPKLYCLLHDAYPCGWSFPHLKTRKELFLEKFPDAEITKDGLPVSCAKYLGLVSYCEQLDNGCCEACWNAPAESEGE